MTIRLGLRYMLDLLVSTLGVDSAPCPLVALDLASQAFARIRPFFLIPASLLHRLFVLHEDQRELTSDLIAAKILSRLSPTYNAMASDSPYTVRCHVVWLGCFLLGPPKVSSTLPSLQPWHFLLAAEDYRAGTWTKPEVRTEGR